MSAKLSKATRQERATTRKRDAGAAALLRAEDVQALLRKRYEEQRGGWAYLTEVSNATGLSSRHRADALALSLWPSRGIELHGHEIKVERRDWLEELKQAAKGTTIQRYCDRWWVVVSDADMVKPGELPPTWGLMAVKAKQIRVVVEAPKLDREEWSVGFIASIFRSVTNNINRTHVARETHQEVLTRVYKSEDEIERQVERRIQERIDQAIARQSPRNDTLLKAAREFEKATGKSLTYYSSKKLIEMVQVAERLQYLGFEHITTALRESADLVDQASARIAELATGSAHPVDGPTSTPGDTAGA